MPNSELIDSIIDRAGVSKQITDTTAELEALDRQLIANVASANALNTAIGRSTSTRQLAQSAQAATAAQERLNNIQTQGAILQERLTQAQARTVAQQERLTANTNRLSGEYQRLVQAFNAANLAARNAGAQFGPQSAQYISAAANVRQLRGQLDAIDQPLGNFQRNVDNYGNSIVNAFKKAFGAIRLVANILPGLGLGGAFLLIFEGLKFIVEQFGLFDKAASTATLTVDAFKKALAEGSEYTSAVKNVSELRENIQLAKEGFLDKDKVVKQFNDSLGKTVGEVSNLNEAEASLNKNAAAFIKFTFLKATANAALEASAKKATEAQLASVQEGFSGADFGDKTKAFLKALDPFAAISAPGTAVDPGKLFLKSEELKKKRIDSANNESKALTKIFEDFQKQAADLAAKNKFDFFGGKGDPKKVADTRKRVLEEQLKQLKLYEEQDLAVETATYDERIAIANKYEMDSIALVRKAIKDKVLTRLDGSNRQIEIDKDAEKDRQKIAKDAQDQLLKTLVQGGKFQDEQLKEQIANFRDLEAQRLLILEQNSAEAFAGLAEQYSKGLITQSEYERQKLDIERQAAKDSIDQQIIAQQTIVDLQKGLIQFGIGNARDLGKAEQDLTKLKITASKQAADAQLQDAQKVATARKNQHDLELQLANDVLDFTKTAIDAGFQKRLDALKTESAALDDNTQKQLDAVSRSIGSEKQKADQTALINAKAQQQKDIIAQKERKIQHDQAVFDKEFNIAKALESVALSEVKALDYLTNPLTAPLYPAIAALIGAIGAVQVATIIAQPIPAFKDGVRDKKTSGLGIWGEAGIELGVMPDGQAVLSPDKATLDYMPKGMDIFSHKELMRMISKPDLPVYAGGREIDVQSLISESKRSTSRLETAFMQREKVSGFSVNSTRRARWEAYKKRNLN